MKTEEEKLYEEAEKRVSFKIHLRTYLLINVLIWVFWYVSRAQYGHYDGYWPVYSTLGWGFGLASHYLSVYWKGSNEIEKEVEKLKKERGLN